MSAEKIDRKCLSSSTCFPRAAYRSSAKGSVVVVWTEEREAAKCDEGRETHDLPATVSQGTVGQETRAVG